MWKPTRKIQNKRGECYENHWVTTKKQYCTASRYAVKRGDDWLSCRFKAKDPLRVIPSCIIGSATAGGLSMAFNCTLRAPHGGIFVLPTIGNPLMYALAIFIGALVGCLVLSFLKKPLPENVEK